MNSFKEYTTEIDISFLIENMEELSPESDKLAMNWLKNHNNSTFCGFVGGKGIDLTETHQKYEMHGVSSSEKLCDIYISLSNDIVSAFEVASNACNGWHNLDSNVRAQHFYNIAKKVEEKKELFAVVESLSSGKHLYRTRSKDVPNLIHSFRQCGDWVLLGFPSKDGFNSYGVTCIISEKYNNPLMSISWKVSSVLAAGNCAVILTDKSNSLCALLLAEICISAGLPAGVLNVLPVDQDNLEFETKLCDEILLLGSAERIKSIMNQTAPSYGAYALSLDIQNQPIVIVYEDSDLNSASHSVLEMLHYNDTRSANSGCKLLLQESIQEQFLFYLEKYISTIRIGFNTSKTDLSCLVTDSQHQKLNLLIKEAQDQDAKVTFGPTAEHIVSPSMRPTLISGVQTSSRIVNEEVGGPVIISIPFRTVKESIAICNSSKAATDVNIWCEKITVALEISHRLNARRICVNSQNIVDVMTSSIGKEQTLLNYCKPILTDKEQNRVDGKIQIFCHKIEKPLQDEKQTFDKSKLVSSPFFISAGDDVNKAVLKAISSKSIWASKSAYDRGQIIHKMANYLFENKGKIISELNLDAESEKEIEFSSERLHYWAAQVHKHTGNIKGTDLFGRVLQIYEPLGVIAAVCPEDTPILSFVSIIAPSIARGNAVITLVSKNLNAVALKLCQIFTSSGVPDNVINVITGDQDSVLHHLYMHADIDSMWVFSKNSILEREIMKSFNIKRVWFINELNWFNFTQGVLEKFSLESSGIKTIYLPMGDIFSN